MLLWKIGGRKVVPGGAIARVRRVGRGDADTSGRERGEATEAGDVPGTRMCEILSDA